MFWAWGILSVWLLAALLGPWLPLQPNTVYLEAIFASPPYALLGGDELGRNIAARLLEGARIALWVAVPTVLISAAIGTLLGMLAAYWGGLWDKLLSYLIDVFMAFPGLLLAIALAGVLGPGLDNLIIALVAVGWVGYARLARAQTLGLKTRLHVRAAWVLGVGEGRILTRHIAPFLAAPLLVEASFHLAACVVAEAGLAFLGLGVQPPQASWGSMIREGARYLLVAPHLALWPGLALLGVTLAVNWIGDNLRDRLDVRRR